MFNHRTWKKGWPGALTLGFAVLIAGCADGPTGLGESLRIVELGAGINPDVAGDHVVWQRHNGGPILHLDVASDRLDTLAEREASLQVDHPTVHGGRAAWMEVSDSGSSIALLPSLEASRKRVTGGSSRGRFPRLSEDLLVWERRGQNDADIFLQHLGTAGESRIAPSTDHQIQPRVDGHRVVWTQFSVEGNERTNFRVRLFDAEVGDVRTLIESDSSHGKPDVSGNVVVWVAPGGDIEYVEVGGPGSVEPNRVDTEASFPAVSVPWIVWVNLEDDGNVWAHNIESGETFPITSNSRLKNFPHISGNRVVWVELDPESWKVMSATFE